ncbi:MAG: acyl-CoA thioesterase [Akkermansiaceae bacterium]
MPPAPASYPHSYRRKVHFADTDAAGVAHFSRVLCYVEEAEHDLLSSLGIPLLEDGGWPRAQVRCDYQAPLHVNEVAEVSLTLGEIGTSSLKWNFKIACGNKIIASGSYTTVRVDVSGKPAPISKAWHTLLSAGLPAE